MSTKWKIYNFYNFLCFSVYGPGIDASMGVLLVENMEFVVNKYV